MRPIQCLLAVLLCVSCAQAQVSYSVLNIAMFMFDSSNATVLNPLTTNWIANRVQLAWYQGLTLYAERIAAAGGYPVYPSGLGGPVTYVTVNVTFINVAKPTDSPAVQIAK